MSLFLFGLIQNFTLLFFLSRFRTHILIILLIFLILFYNFDILFNTFFFVFLFFSFFLYFLFFLMKLFYFILNSLSVCWVILLRISLFNLSFFLIFFLRNFFIFYRLVFLICLIEFLMESIRIRNNFGFLLLGFLVALDLVYILLNRLFVILIIFFCFLILRTWFLILVCIIRDNSRVLILDISTFLIIFFLVCRWSENIKILLTKKWSWIILTKYWLYSSKLSFLR